MIDIRNWNAHDERWEDDILDALELRRLHYDTWRTSARHKALRLKTYSQAAARLADIVHISKKADVELVNRSGAKNLRIADGNHLRLPEG